MPDQLTKAKVRQLGIELEELVQKFAEEHGLTAEYGGGKFDSETFTPKITLKREGADRVAFAEQAHWYGLKPEDFGAEFTNGFKRMKIVGINTRAQRYPILAQEIETGKRYKVSEESVIRALAAERATV